ncbi:alpha/beta hydrolase [Paenibacillus sp. JTLBN-2024]
MAKAGYRVVVPDQRGYHLSDKPEGVESYVLDKLRDDIVGLIKTLSPNQKAIVGGHDWGGAVAWHLASTRSQYVEKLIIVNMPHPRVMMKVLPFYPPQWKKSSYIAFSSSQMFQRQHFKKITFKSWMKPLGLLQDHICSRRKMSQATSSLGRSQKRLDFFSMLN